MSDSERLDILNDQGLRILQKPGAFRFGTDSVLLADFAPVKPNDRVVDLGTGTGILPILMASRVPGAQFDALEIQPDMADMAARSVALNRMEDRIHVHACDLRRAEERFGHGKFTLAVCNPPYGKAKGTIQSQSEAKRLARHEAECTIEEIASAAGRLLKVGGRLAVIFPAPRLLELMCALRKCHLEPKRLRTIHALPGRAPKFVLLDAVKGGGSQLHWMEPLVLSDADGEPSAEWRRIYRVDDKQSKIGRKK